MLQGRKRPGGAVCRRFQTDAESLTRTSGTPARDGASPQLLAPIGPGLGLSMGSEPLENRRSPQGRRMRGLSGQALKGRLGITRRGGFGRRHERARRYRKGCARFPARPERGRIRRACPPGVPTGSGKPSEPWDGSARRVFSRPLKLRTARPNGSLSWPEASRLSADSPMGTGRASCRDPETPAPALRRRRRSLPSPDGPGAKPRDAAGGGLARSRSCAPGGPEAGALLSGRAGRAVRGPGPALNPGPCAPSCFGSC